MRVVAVVHLLAGALVLNPAGFGSSSRVFQDTQKIEFVSSGQNKSVLMGIIECAVSQEILSAEDIFVPEKSETKIPVRESVRWYSYLSKSSMSHPTNDVWVPLNTIRPYGKAWAALSVWIKWKRHCGISGRDVIDIKMLCEDRRTPADIYKLYFHIAIVDRLKFNVETTIWQFFGSGIYSKSTSAEANKYIGPFKFDQSAFGYLCRPLGGRRVILCSPPEEPCTKDQKRIEKNHPNFGLEPGYFSLGGFMLGGAVNFLGCWLYFYDDRWGRWRWRGRSRLGACVMALALVILVGGIALSIAEGGGY